ncbi:uncharacterized protein LOC122501540 [Leptopilina heterotoma]|uniref:uncharacterized protein LOC122501540 n=1 Tax=Leptopilina heterotoma TaxID=63436 RepID=UPI001CAA1FAB|nr:uncharacterized protein LOC122501540 [Leptopilina heterotoma]
MGSRLAQTIIEKHSIKISKRTFWTDSQTVLKWVHSDARKYQHFVAHRIAEILETTRVQEWCWTPTSDNVADDATRDSDHLSLSNNCRWLTGPEFLLLEEHLWPMEVQKYLSEEIDKELRREFTLVISEASKFPFDCSRFSKWSRLIRSMDWFLRFIKKIRNRSKDNLEEELTAQEVHQGEIHVLRMAQLMDFEQELRHLKQGNVLPSSSRLKELSPELVKLLILSYHQQSEHQGRERVANDLRSRYWIIKIRSGVRAVCHDCQFCKIRKAKPIVPKMAPLPDLRTQDLVKPFTNTGVDYFNSFYVTIGRRREKRYGVLFTCLNIRAVHLEIANSLSTDSIVMALRRMMARRGKPR